MKKRCSGYKGHWECADDYPDHMVPVGNFDINKKSKDGLRNMCKKDKAHYHLTTHPIHPIDGIRKKKWKEKFAKSLGGIQNTPEWKSYLDRAEEQWNKEVTVWETNNKVADITPRFKSEYGPSKPMTKRESTVLDGERIPQGWVYIVINPDVPWILKIGKTYPDGISQIITSARRFGRAELVDKFWFEDALQAEKDVHAMLSKYNLRNLDYQDCGMELFKCTYQEAKDAITKVQSRYDRPSIAVGK